MVIEGPRVDLGRGSAALPLTLSAVRANLLTIGIAVGVFLGASACGGEESASGPPSRPSAFETPYVNDEVYPVFVSSELTVGPNRFLVGLLNDEDAPIGSPRVDVHVSFFRLDDSTTDPVTSTNMHWVWVTRPYSGLYASDVRFDEPGQWGAEVKVKGPNLAATVRGSFDIREQSSTPAIGERVPVSETPTAATLDAARRISTDERPELRFYATSIDEALSEREPFVVVFATPKFCASQTCGPMLDTVKMVSERWAAMTFIHVEPYELPADPAELEPVRAAREWGLPSEPWTFVVDARGRLAAKFEGALAAAELDAALRRLR